PRKRDPAGPSSIAGRIFCADAETDGGRSADGPRDPGADARAPDGGRRQFPAALCTLYQCRPPSHQPGTAGYAVRYRDKCECPYAMESMELPVFPAAGGDPLPKYPLYRPDPLVLRQP